MQHRSYRAASDVALLQSFNAAAIAATDHCGFVHPGDIPHRLFNGNRWFDPAEVLTIWEAGGRVAAWVLAAPRHPGYDAQVRPDLRGGEFELKVLAHAEAKLVDLMRCHQIEAGRLLGDAYQGDAVRASLLVEAGWTLDEAPAEVLNRARLADLAEPEIPDGYAIRPAGGLDDAAALAEVHAASFGSTWTPDSYRTLMQSPGYAAEREYVVEAADGSFAAFTVTWHDHVNRIGLFEPVGTHPDHRRRGLAAALLRFVAQRMAAAGMVDATVVNLADNPASRDLYRSCGFEPWHLIDGYTKPVSL